jgi:hypothetical protein
LVGRKVRQILLNLSNAVKFTAEGSITCMAHTAMDVPRQ